MDETQKIRMKTMTNLKSHPVPTYAAYGGVPTDAAYGGEPQYIATPFGWVKNDAEYKKYMAQKQQKTSIPNNDEQPNRQQNPIHWERQQINDNLYQKSNSTNDGDCYMSFDGEKLDLFRGQEKIDSLDAMSGQHKYQVKKFQNVHNKGPIPEGTYYANQNQRQTIGAWDAAVGATTGILGINRGKWKGSLPAWGMRRIWLEPDSKTNTYGRKGFTIHGGWNKGSAGCIDIPWQTGELSDYMDDCQESVPVYVNYPKDNW